MQQTSNKNNNKDDSQQFYTTTNSEIEGDIQILKVICLKIQPLRIAISLLFCLLFGLIPLIAARFSILWRRKLFYALLKFQELSKSTHFLVYYSDDTLEILKQVNFNPTQDTNFQELITIGFRARKLNYVFDHKQAQFKPLESILFKQNTVSDIINRYNIQNCSSSSNQSVIQAMTNEDAKTRLDSFGQCLIDIDIPHILVYMAEEMTTPLYFIQYFAILVWLLELYYMFAILMICFSVSLTVVNYLFLRSSMIKLREKALIITKIQTFRNNDVTGNQKIQLNTDKVNNSIQIFHNEQVEHSNIGLLPNKQNLFDINSDLLVPGDLIILQENMTMPCDCILISGEVYVNEVTLTGESIPVPKFEVNIGDGSTYYEENQKTNIKSVLFEGTKIIKIRSTNSRVENLPLAIVQRTGFSTFKGQIFRSLVFIKNKRALFQTTAGKFIGIIALIGLITVLILIFQFINDGLEAQTIVLKVFDMIIFVAPPAVPIMTTFCLTMSLARLRTQNIFGINPQSLLAAGKVSTICFDKTGTLTDLHLEFNNFILSNQKQFDPSIEINAIINTPISKLDEFTQSHLDIAYYLFGSCHNLIFDSAGEMLGDPLEIKMFKASGFQLITNDTLTKVKYNSLEIQILRSFPFSSDDQCMSVAIQHYLTNQTLSLVKGSPEKLKRISKVDTIPNDFDQILNKYTMQGLRVLGMGYKPIDKDKVANILRSEMENDLVFIGFLVFVNRLKHDTAEVIARLKSKQFKIKMISGDNSLTCASTAKNANIVAQDAKFIILEQEQNSIYIREIQEKEIITLESFNFSTTQIPINTWISQNQFLNLKDKEFVMNGQVLETLLSLTNQCKKSDQLNLLNLIKRTSLFGRCRPEHKAMVIKSLRKIKIQCAMVGDGANDCPAIKAADLGISFAETDAAISAPFSSMSSSISCVENIIMEGKCTTQNSIEALRYQCTTGMYKFVLCSVLIFSNSWFNESQRTFLTYYVGTTIFNAFFGLNKPFDQISMYNPNDNLVSWYFILTFFGNVILGSLGFIIIYIILINMDWYLLPLTSLSNKSIANTVLGFYINLVSISTLFCMYLSAPFKQRIYRNYILFVSLIVKLIWMIVYVFNPLNTVKGLDTLDYPTWFGWVILGVTAFTFILMYTFEYILQQRYLKSMLQKLQKSYL